MANFVDLDIITDLPWLVLQCVANEKTAHTCLAAFARKDDAIAFGTAAGERDRLACKIVRAVPEDYKERP